MTEKSEQEVKCRKLIRSILLCKQNGCLLRMFEGEYQSFTGEPLPYKRLGYISVRRFLESMPDVVEFRTIRDATVLFAVSDKSTKHIDVLVKEQRPSNKKSFAQTGARPKFAGHQPKKSLPYQTTKKIASIVNSCPEVKLKKQVYKFPKIGSWRVVCFIYCGISQCDCRCIFASGTAMSLTLLVTVYPPRMFIKCHILQI